MNIIQDIFSDQLIYAVSNALLHSLWQGGLLAFILASLLYVLRRYTARMRYRLITCFLFVFFIGNMATGIYSYQSWSAPAGTYTTYQLNAAAPQMTGDFTGSALIDKGLQNDNTLVYAFSYVLTLYRESASLVLTIWLVGMLLFSMRLSTGLAYTYKLRSSCIPGRVSGEWKQKALNMATRIGISTKFDMAESRLADSPMVVGMIRPMILLPLGTFTGTQPDHIEAIIAHELAHIKRRDYLVNILMQIVESVYFYHPA
ncbi:MAG: M56 family metallopeptidase, partial [Cyclobacteriaceae bacterium]